MTQPWIIAVLVAVLAPLFTYLGIVRKTSGRIATTEASKLWEEAGSLRAVYRDEITRLHDAIEVLDREIRSLKIENQEFKVRIAELEKSNGA